MKTSRKISRKKTQVGFTLMETMIATAVMLIAVSGIFALLSAAQQLWTNGFAINNNSMHTRQLYDRLTLDLYQSPFGIGSPVELDTSTTRLREQRGEPCEGLVYATVAGGPLKIDASSAIAAGTTGITVELPALDTNLHAYSLASQQDIQIREGDYVVITGSSYESYLEEEQQRITAVTDNGDGSWDLTLQNGFDQSIPRSGVIDDITTTDGSFDLESYTAVTIIRYNAYLLIEDLTAQGRTGNGVVQYEGLEVTDWLGYEPVEWDLPSSYETDFLRVISHNLIPYPFLEAPYDAEEDNLKPFFRSTDVAVDGENTLPWIRIRMAITGGEFSDVIEVGEMARVSNVDTRIYLRSM